MAFGVAYSPALIGGAIRGASISWATQTLGSGGGGGVLLGGVSSLPQTLARIARAFGGDDLALLGVQPSLVSYLAIGFVALFLLGTLAERRLRPVVAPALVSVVLWALLLAPSIRYGAYVFPLGYLAVAVALDRGPTRWRRTVTVALIAVVVGAFLWGLGDYYATVDRRGLPNDYLWSDAARLEQESFLIVGDITEEAPDGGPRLWSCRMYPEGGPGAPIVSFIATLLSLDGKLQVRTPLDLIQPQREAVLKWLPGKSLVVLTDAARDKLGDLVSGWEPLVKRRCYGIYRPSG